MSAFLFLVLQEYFYLFKYQYLVSLYLYNVAMQNTILYQFFPAPNKNVVRMSLKRLTLNKDRSHTANILCQGQCLH